MDRQRHMGTVGRVADRFNEASAIRSDSSKDARTVRQALSRLRFESYGGEVGSGKRLCVCGYAGAHHHHTKTTIEMSLSRDLLWE